MTPCQKSWCQDKRVGSEGLPDVDGMIDMAARRQVTNKLRTLYGKASKADKSTILEWPWAVNVHPVTVRPFRLTSFPLTRAGAVGLLNLPDWSDAVSTRVVAFNAGRGAEPRLTPFRHATSALTDT